MKVPASRKNLVVGLGSLLSGDDSFGPLVLDRLIREEPGSFPDTDLVCADTDLISQIDQFPKYSRVILVDTVLDPDERVGRHGDIIVLDEETFLAWPDTSPSVHQISPLVAVKLFRKLHPNAGTRIILIALCTNRIALGPAESNTPGDHIIDSGVRLARSLLS